MISATSLPIALNPCCDRLPQHAPNLASRACMGMRRLEPDCADSTAVDGTLLADGLCTGLKPVEDLQGTLVSGECNSGRYSIESCA
jgi:hypothetical protein